MFEKELYSMLSDMSSRHREYNFLKNFYIKKRLQKSLDTYTHELEQSVKYLSNRKPEKVVKKL